MSEKTTTEDKKVLREVRDAIVNGFVSLTHILFFWMPGDVAKGKALMALHPFMGLVIIALFFVLERRSPWKIVIAFVAIVVAASQWVFRGCLVTRAEQKLTGNTETIVDPFLGLANIAANRDTRQAATLAVGTAIAVVMILVVACDTFLRGVSVTTNIKIDTSL